jgi:hypothetical protein
MNWFQQNRWLGNFLAAFAVGLLLAFWFLLHARNEFSEASTQFNEAAKERNRLEHLDPFPNEENFRKTQAAFENYRASLNKTKEELKTQVVPSTPLTPSEFQSRLRQAILNVTERARANRVKLPESFHLGFNEFITALPDTAAASLFGQQLGQIELLVNILIDNRVDEITNLKRPNASTGLVASPIPVAGKPPKAAKQSMVVERGFVSLVFKASPLAQRKVLNQIASSERQFLIVRALQIRNERQEAPSREQAGATLVGSAVTPASAIKFIVGNEHVETAALVELVRFTF